MKSDRGVLVAMREVWVLVEEEEEEQQQVLRSVPGTTMFLVDWRIDVALYGDLYDDVEVVFDEVPFLVLSAG